MAVTLESFLFTTSVGICKLNNSAVDCIYFIPIRKKNGLFWLQKGFCIGTVMAIDCFQIYISSNNSWGRIQDLTETAYIMS